MDNSIGLLEGCADGSPVNSAQDDDRGITAVTGSSVDAKKKKGPSGGLTKPNSSEAVVCPPLPYLEPSWSGIADSCYSLEVLKNGFIISTLPLTKKSFYVFGRLPNCDVSLEHPSISRYHAVLQFRLVTSEEHQKGFYIYDLGSTHGTVVNKVKIQPKEYFRLKVGHIIKFGGSSRLFILQGPENDQEEESELTVTELKQLHQKHRKELEKRMLGEDSDGDDDCQEERRRERRSTTSKTADTGCSWGMVEDAEEEEECEENPFAVDYQQEREALYIKDPKKALQGFFEREGEELEYEYEDQGHSTWLCRVRLPVDDASGRQLVAEATHSGKKKEALIECALEACRILDAKGLLRQEAVSRKRKAKNWEEEDFYDSDDDAFLDRTGSIEKKRLNRMKKAGKIDEKPETYESLLTKLSAVEKELTEIEDKLLSANKGSSQSSEDPLDAFMIEIRSGGVLDSVARKKLHLQSFELKKEEQRLKKLIKIARPTSLPNLKSQNGSSPAAETKPKKYVLPMFGAMKGGSKFKLKTGTVGKPPPKRPDLPKKLLQIKDEGPEVEEEVEEDEEDEYAATSSKNKRSIPEPAQANAEVFQQDIDMPDSSGGANCYNNNKNDLSLHSDPFDNKEKISEIPGMVHTLKNRQSPLKSATESGLGSTTSVEEITETKKKMYGPSKPPAQVLSSQYPGDDPDYCVWVPPTDQSGDGRTHLNDKYGY